MEEKVDQAASDLNLNLTQDQKDQLVSLFDKMKNINIDWKQVGSQIDKAKDKITKFIESDEGKTFYRRFGISLSLFGTRSSLYLLVENKCHRKAA